VNKALERLADQVDTTYKDDKVGYNAEEQKLQQYLLRIRNFKNMMADIKRGQ
jgi:hypothetical protein